MAYLLSDRNTKYLVKVTKTNRGHKIVVKREFDQYEDAMAFLDRMEALYDTNHIVEFDTKFS